MRYAGGTSHARCEAGVARTLIVTLAALAAACTSDGTSTGAIVAHISVSPKIALVTEVGGTQQFAALAQDQSNKIVNSPFLIWRSRDRDIFTIDPNTGLATAVGAGTAVVAASAGTVVGEASLEVYVDPNEIFIPGETYFGRRQYIEYQAGNLPIILSAPHGGSVEPEEIDDRTWGVRTTDSNTEELIRAVGEAIRQRTGHHPHIVIAHLRRTKLDANREILEAAQGNTFAKQAWAEYHDFIQTAKNQVNADHGQGFYVDLHGHGHPIQRLELGYLLDADDLALADASLNDPSLASKSSIRTLATDAAATFAELIRGENSIGTLMEQRGFLAVPSTSQPNPGTDPYFTGGFSTARYGSQQGGKVSGMQVETPFAGVRDNPINHQAFAEALAEALETFLLTHYNVDWTDPIPASLH